MTKSFFPFLTLTQHLVTPHESRIQGNKVANTTVCILFPSCRLAYDEEHTVIVNVHLRLKVQVQVQVTLATTKGIVLLLNIAPLEHRNASRQEALALA